MNIVSRVTLRYLKLNRRRTLITIIGVIISSAMITAVLTIGVSFMDMMKRQEIADNGEWHVLYENVNPDQIAAVRDDKMTEKLALIRERGFAMLKESRNRYKPYLFIKEYSTRGYEMFPITLVYGRLPQNSSEVVISEEIIENAGVDFRIGQQLTLDVGQRIFRDDEDNVFVLTQNETLRTTDGKIAEALVNQHTFTYTIVGVIERPSWEPTWASGYTVIGFIDEGTLGEHDTVDAAVVLSKVRRSVYSHARGLADKNSIKTVRFNNSLLRYYGVTSIDEIRKTLYGITTIILVIIIIGSVSLIYNAFAISVSERSRQLGMLSSIGATRKQKRNSVFYEGMVIGLISIPLGIACGIAGIWITFLFINSLIKETLFVTENLVVKVTPISLIAAVVISAVTIFVSTWIPARKASKIPAIDAIRQTTDIKLTGKAVRTSKLIRRLFGIEAEIALKNLKRNKRRYKATVFSIVISIVLFLTVSYFTVNLRKAVEVSQDGYNFDINVDLGFDEANNRQIIEEVTSRSEITAFTVIKETAAVTWIDKEAASDEIRKRYENNPDALKDGKYPYNLKICALDSEALKAYAKLSGADYEELADTGKLSGILINVTEFTDTKSRRYIETKPGTFKTGQGIEVYKTDDSTEKGYLDTIEIISLTDEMPMGIFIPGPGNLIVIVSEETLKQIVPDTDDALQTNIFLKSSDPMTTQHAIEEKYDYNIFILNIYKSAQDEERMILIISVFTYGFISLITAICIANIFNTISTSIAIRKREFAMLKSVGMTPKGFNKMINYESIFYGLKALAYGLPLSFGVMFLLYRQIGYSSSYGFLVPWKSIIIAVTAVFIIVGSAMLYSGAKVKKENIIEAIKQENI